MFRVDNIPALFSKIFSERHSQSARAQGAKELEKLTVSMVKVLLERSGVMKHGEQVAKRLQRAEDEVRESPITKYFLFAYRVDLEVRPSCAGPYAGEDEHRSGGP